MRRHCYIIALICFAIAFLVTCRGCAEGQEISVHPHCLPEAIYCAIGWQSKTGEAVRIIVQKIEKTASSDIDHVQTEAYHRGEWTPLTTAWNEKGVVCVPYKRHFNVEPYRYVDLRTFVNEQVR